MCITSTAGQRTSLHTQTHRHTGTQTPLEGGLPGQQALASAAMCCCHVLLRCAPASTHVAGVGHDVKSAGRRVFAYAPLRAVGGRVALRFAVIVVCVHGVGRVGRGGGGTKAAWRPLGGRHTYRSSTCRRRSASQAHKTRPSTRAGPPCGDNPPRRPRPLAPRPL